MSSISASSRSAAANRTGKWTTSKRRYGEFLHSVLDAEGGALWHCSQGKDRCGWGSAFVLAALGASRELFYGNVYRKRSGPAE